MAEIADLEAVLGPPATIPPVVDWQEIERMTGLCFPGEYKEFAARYSELTIDAFLLVFHPGVPRKPRRMLREVEALLEPLRRLLEDRGGIDLIDDRRERSRIAPFPLYPDNGGLFPWGSTENGDICFWSPSSNPREWSVVVTNGGGLWWRYDGGMLDFLVGVLTDSIACPLFPRRFPGSLRMEERGK